MESNVLILISALSYLCGLGKSHALWALSFCEGGC